MPESIHPKLEEAQTTRAAAPTPLGRYLIAAFAVIGSVIAIGALPKIRRREMLAQTQAASGAPRRVLVGKVASAPRVLEQNLPGSVAPFQSTQLFAKTTGFVRSYAVDIGDTVKAGDVLAVIDAPETKEELSLALARRKEAEVNLDITKAIADRKDSLTKSGLATQQEADEQRAKANSAIAALGSTRAEVGRLGALLGYQKVVAPFDGVIVRRGVEKGSLVLPGTGNSGTMIFEVGKVDALKVYVDVPQSIANSVRIGTKVTVFMPNAPQAKVEGKIVRTSGVLDPVARTMRSEIHLPGGGPLLSGAFVTVRVTVERANPPLTVPASALVYRKEGTRVATLEANGVVKMKSITIGRDLGKDLELTEGVASGETVVLNPPDDLVDGMTVTPVEPKPDAR